MTESNKHKGNIISLKYKTAHQRPHYEIRVDTDWKKMFAKIYLTKKTFLLRIYKELFQFNNKAKSGAKKKRRFVKEGNMHNQKTHEKVLKSWGMQRKPQGDNTI